MHVRSSRLEKESTENKVDKCVNNKQSLFVEVITNTKKRHEKSMRFNLNHVLVTSVNREQYMRYF